MPTYPGRPKPKTLVIDDCVSAIVYDNPAPNCPHGKHWRESDYEQLTESLKALMCAEPGCEAVEYHPHAGERIELTLGRTFAARRPLQELWATLGQADQTALVGMPGLSTRDRLAAVLVESVSAWTWTGAKPGDPTATEPLPLPRDDFDRVMAGLELSEVLWIIEALIVWGDPRKVGQKMGESGSASASG